MVWFVTCPNIVCVCCLLCERVVAVGLEIVCIVCDACMHVRYFVVGCCGVRCLLRVVWCCFGGYGLLCACWLLCVFAA